MDTRTIDGTTYTLVKKQRSGAAIYRGRDSYLRIGSREVIAQQIATHRELESLGVPVAHIQKVGEQGNDSYFIEASLGEERFMDIFEADTRASGAITDEHFVQFLDISKQFLDAQIRAPERERSETDFSRAIHLDLLQNELPQYKEQLQHLFATHMTAIGQFPFKLMHGDFNAANIYPHGIIDFEDIASGPLGYDAITTIASAEWFPQGEEYEFQGKYQFTADQCAAYMNAMDALMGDHRLPLLSDADESYRFFRAVWLTVRMHEWPKLQKYRYDLFIKKYLA